MPLTIQEAMWALGPRIRGQAGMGGMGGPQLRNGRVFAGMGKSMPAPTGTHTNAELPAKGAAGKTLLDSVSSTLNQIRQALTLNEPDLASDPSSAGVLQAGAAAVSALQGAGDALAAAIPGTQQSYGSFDASNAAWMAVDAAQQNATAALTQYRDLPAKLNSAARTAKSNISSAMTQAQQQQSQQAQGRLDSQRTSVLSTIAQAENALAAANGAVNDAAAQGADTSDAEGLLVSIQGDIGSLRSQVANAQDSGTLAILDARASSALSKIGTATSSAKRALATYARQQALDAQRKAAEDTAAARADAAQQRQLEFQQQREQWQQQQQQAQLDYQRQQQDAALARQQALEDAAAARAQAMQPGPIYPGTAVYQQAPSTNVYVPDPYGPGSGYAPGSPGYFDANAFGPQYEAAGYGPGTMPPAGAPPPVMQPGPGYGRQQPSMWDPGAELFGMPGLSGMGAAVAAGSLPGRLTPGYTLSSFDGTYFIITTPEGDQVSMSQDQANQAAVQVTDQKGRVFYQGPAASTTVSDVSQIARTIADVTSEAYGRAMAARQGRPYGQTQPAAPVKAGWTTGEKVAAGVAGLFALAIVGPKVVRAFAPKRSSYPAETFGF